jgi:Family of unknown function (DUF5681)
MSNGEEKDRPYEVGYGKPPVATRFQKNHGGHRRKGPPKPQSFEADVRAELEKRVVFTENGKQRRATMQEYIAARLTKNAAKGNAKALDQLVRVMGRKEYQLPPEPKFPEREFSWSDEQERLFKELHDEEQAQKQRDLK